MKTVRISMCVAIELLAACSTSGRTISTEDAAVPSQPDDGGGGPLQPDAAAVDADAGVSCYIPRNCPPETLFVELHDLTSGAYHFDVEIRSQDVEPEYDNYTIRCDATLPGQPQAACLPTGLGTVNLATSGDAGPTIYVSLPALNTNPPRPLPPVRVVGTRDGIALGERSYSLEWEDGPVIGTPECGQICRTSWTRVTYP